MAGNVLEIKIKVEGRDAQQVLEGVSRRLKGVGDAGRRGAQGLENVSRSSRAAEHHLKRLSRTADQVKRAFQVAFGVIAAYQFVNMARGVAQVIDQYQQLSARLRLVSDSAKAYAQAQEQLYQISQRTRVSLSTTYELYVRMANATRELGVSQQELLKVTEALNTAVLVSGASTQEAQAALLQLSQAMASGRLQGDELRSVFEQMPILARAIAKEMGVTIGQLRELGSQGQITTEVMLQALSHLYDELQTKVSEIPITVSQIFVVLENSWQRLIGESDRLGGVFDVVKAAALALAKTFDQLRTGELSADWEVLGKIGVHVFSGIVTVVEYVGKAFLGLKYIWETLKVIFWGLVWAVAEGVELIQKGILKVVQAFDKLPMIDLQGEISAVKESIQSTLELKQTAIEAQIEAKKSRNETVQGIEAIGSLAQSFRQNFTTTLENLKKAGENGKKAFQQTGKAAEKTGQNIAQAYDALKLFNLELKRQEEVSRAAQGLEEVYHQLFLQTLPDGQRQIEEIRDKYTELIAQAAEWADVTGDWERYNEIVQMALDLQEKEITALQERKNAHQEVAEKIQHIWEHTYERITDIVADWIYDFRFSLDDITNLFRRAAAQIVATWITSWVKMQAVNMSSGSNFLDLLVKGFQVVAGVFSGTGGASYMPVDLSQPAPASLPPLQLELANYSAIYHRGGIVGLTPAPVRLVPSNLFENAPRLHSGLAPDEFPAILQRGEIVLPKDTKIKNREQQTPVIIINAIDVKTFEDYVKRNPGAIITIVNDALKRNTALTQTVRSL